MTGRIAIDFGTTRTKVAGRPADGGPAELLRFGEHLRPFTPSLFYMSGQRDAAVLFGDAAEEMLEEDPAGVIVIAKRRLRHGLLRANGWSATPRDLLEGAFRGLRLKAGREFAFLGGALPDAVVLTVPASFGEVERDVVTAAARAAGFAGVELVSEPVAAARAWLAGAKTGEADRLVVLDAGGGTIDWTYLKREADGQFRVVASHPPGGVDGVGGHDVDLGLLDLVERRLDELGSSSGEFSPSRRARLLGRLRRVKEAVSRGREPDGFAVGDARVPLCRADVLEVIASRFLSGAVAALDAYLRAIAEAEAAGEATGVEAPPVLLVGGSASLPGLREALAAAGHRLLDWGGDGAERPADFAAALGALAPSLPEPQPEPPPLGRRTAIRCGGHRAAGWADDPRQHQGSGKSVDTVTRQDGRPLVCGGGRHGRSWAASGCGSGRWAHRGDLGGGGWNADEDRFR